jgi:hypothetical protein
MALKRIQLQKEGFAICQKDESCGWHESGFGKYKQESNRSIAQSKHED